MDAAPIEMLSHRREHRQVDDLVHEIVLHAVHHAPPCRAVEDREGLAEVVDVGALLVAEADVARGEERRGYRRQVGVRGRGEMHLDVEGIGAVARRPVKIGEVPAHLLHQLGRGARHFDGEAVEVEMRGHGRFQRQHTLRAIVQT